MGFLGNLNCTFEAVPAGNYVQIGKNSNLIFNSCDCDKMNKRIQSDKLKHLIAKLYNVKLKNIVVKSVAIKDAEQGKVPYNVITYLDENRSKILGYSYFEILK